MGKKKTHEQFIKEFSKKNPNVENIKILGEYQGDKKPILCECLIHNHTWSPRAEKLLIGQGCPMCANNIKKTTEEFKEELKNINPNIEILGEYINNKTHIPCRCLKCSHTWETAPSILINNNSGCPKCSESKGEKRITRFLINNNIENKTQVTFEDLIGTRGGLLSYDFYLPKYNLLIEYQGNYHDGTVNKRVQSDEKFNRQQEHDRRKREYTEKNNIQLLEIWYWDFDNIEKILKQQLNL